MHNLDFNENYSLIMIKYIIYDIIYNILFIRNKFKKK